MGAASSVPAGTAAAVLMAAALMGAMDAAVVTSGGGGNVGAATILRVCTPLVWLSRSVESQSNTASAAASRSGHQAEERC